MAGSSLLMLIDDIAAVLDDVAVMSKVAAKKTAGVLGDDLALNTEQVAGATFNRADRELPVVWAVAKGSLVNKAILVPLALAISTFASWAVTPLLMMGGAYLCYEGFEKIAHKLLHSPREDDAHRAALAKATDDIAIDMLEFEKEKIKGAVRTDFVLSAEIIVITLGTVAAATFTQQVVVLVAIALIMTVGVYGFVAAIVKLDDVGFYLMRKYTGVPHLLGRGMVRFAPLLMKLLSIAGTVAMFLVGGGIIVHGIHPLQSAISSLAVDGGSSVTAIVPTFANGLVGILVGAGVLLVVQMGQRILKKLPARN